MDANNASVVAADREHANPRPLDGAAWARALGERFPTIAREWDAFVANGGRLPRIEDVLDEHQGNEGSWRAGLLMHRGRPVLPLAEQFPATIAALDTVPGLLNALWSVLEPGTELPAHVGPNAGVLRYHLTVQGDGTAALQVADTVVPYVAGEAVLFDDTATHAAWNRGTTDRVSHFCEILRPVRGRAQLANRAMQRLLALDRRYRRAPRRAAEWHHALNPARSR
jgi:beta-hydroxylase